MSDGFTYRSAGVDQDRKDAAVEEALRHAERTRRPGVIANPGGFAALFSLRDAGRWKDPVLVSSTDGVGTKLRLANVLGRHDTVGVDLVAMSVNDLVVTGAEPLFFLDYIAAGRVDPRRIEAIIAGVAEGCRQAGCALVGGETAEMPGMYQGEDYDLAGFAVGAVERGDAITGALVEPGDALIGVSSSGVHSNGYSLVRKVFVREGEPGGGALLAERPPSLGGRTIGEALLEPTRIYAGAVKALLARLAARTEVRSIAHITGAGITGNLPRVLPAHVGARIRRGAWPRPPVFDLIARHGQVAEDEMFRVFNMGLGLIVAVPPSRAPETVQVLTEAGFPAFVVGEAVAGRSAGVDGVEILA